MLRQCGVKSYSRVYILVRKLTVPESAKLLGVGENADNKEIKSAFLKKAKLYHPDNQVRFLAFITGYRRTNPSPRMEETRKNSKSSQKQKTF